MTHVLTPTLVPILIVAVILAVVVRLRSPERLGLQLYCLGLIAWALSVLLTVVEGTRPMGERLLMAGFLVPAGYLHAVWEDLRAADMLVGGGPRALRRSRAVVGATWVVALAFFGVGIVRPDLFLAQGGGQPGPWFWLMFGAGAVMSTWPLVRLGIALRQAGQGARERMSYLLLAGFMGVYGGGVNVLQMLTQQPSPVGLYMVLGSLALLAWVVQSAHLPTFGRFVEHSLRYSVAAALLTTAYLFAVLVFLAPEGADAAWSAASWSNAVLLFLLVLVGQPLLTWARGGIARQVFPGRGDVEGLARALAESEAKAEHAERLAEIGALAGAVAHEVRNPLGVIAAATRILERTGGEPGAIGEIRTQVERASRFADELLEYGRPAPLQRRPVALEDVALVACSEVTMALGELVPDLVILGPRRTPEAPAAPPATGVPVVQIALSGASPSIQGDPAQLIRLLGVLVENAVLAVYASGGGQVQLTLSTSSSSAGPAAWLTLEDSGPGVPEALAHTLFQPFVSGRGRDGPRPGTGLGLAIAKGIVERHDGSLELLDPATLGGARFRLSLPVEPPMPAGG